MGAEPMDGSQAMNARPRLTARLRYQLDNTMARSVTPVIGLLGIVTAVVVLMAGAVLWVARVRVDGRMASGVEGFWLSLVRTLDPGTMGADVGWPFRVTSLVVTITGILILSTLIGLLSSGVARRLEHLRRGRSDVLETGHTLILGWSPKLYLLLTELDAAVEGGGKGCAVVLADRDTVEMEDELEAALPHLRHLRVVTRSGDPTDPNTLRRVAPFTAHSVTVLSHDEYGDAYTTRCVLALESVGLRPTVPVVIELSAARRALALTTASDLKVQTVIPGDWIAAIAARVVLQPSLSAVYENLLDFNGSELHRLEPRADLVGMTIRDITRTISQAAVVGLENESAFVLAPDPTTVVGKNDQLLVIAETSLSPRFGVKASALWNDPALKQRPVNEAPASMAVIGWSNLGSRILQELDRLVVPRSRLQVCVEDQDGVDALLACELTNLEINYEIADPTDPAEIRHLLEDPLLDRVVLLAGRSDIPSYVADARVLLSMLELRHVISHERNVQVVAELCNPQSMDLVSGEHREVFVVGDRLVCLLMAQAIHDDHLLGVLREIVQPDGPDLMAVPGSHLMDPGHSTKYGVLAQYLLDSNEYLLGYLRDGRVVFHPDASEIVSDTDEFIVLAETTPAGALR